jgi:predicted RNA-binding Zn-ribbon protein involved in translation (DUF1610 family)
MTEATAPHVHENFACEQCGSTQEFKPGAGLMVCPSCGFENAMPDADDEIEELDFHEAFAALEEGEEGEDVFAVACPTCGAQLEREADVSSEDCPFCGTTIVAAGGSTRKLKPRSLLPFKITRQDARTWFQQWVGKRWFAPNDFKKRARLDSKLSGMYVPHWTYDAQATTEYSGLRGVYYYVPVTVSTGKGTTTTMQRRTAWSPVSGVVDNTFDDLLVLASHSLPTAYMEKLEPWDLDNLVAYQPEYLSGFRAESYQVNLEEGFTEARQQMDRPIRENIRRDIGGNEQRISNMHSAFNNITFKHLLLPVWISTYRFKNKPYRFLVNARTGEVQGERPWSYIKIGLAIAGALTSVGGAIAAFMLLA